MTWAHRAHHGVKHQQLQQWQQQQRLWQHRAPVLAGHGGHRHRNIALSGAALLVSLMVVLAVLPSHQPFVLRAGRVNGVALAATASAGAAGKPLKAAEAYLTAARGDAAKMRQAYASIKKLVDESPGDIELMLKAAEAAVGVMRITSHANGLVCKFGSGKRPEVEKQDTPENRELWAEWASRAQESLQDVEAMCGSEEFSKDPYRSALRLETSMYSTSSRGIVSAVLSGNAVSFLRNIAQLEQQHPSWDGGIYCSYWGAYYLAAPWPAFSASKARAYFDRGAKAFPHSQRNQYFAGVGAFMEGDFDAARAAMQRALEEECASPSEQDVCAFFTREAERTLTMLST